MKNIQLEDFIQFKYLSNLKMNSKKDCVYVQTTANKITNGYDSNLIFMKDEVSIQLTSGNKENNFIFLDDDTILFKTIRNEADKEMVAKGEELSVFYKMSLLGGEAQEYFKVPLNVMGYKKVDEDTFVLQVAYDRRYSHMHTLEDKSEVLKLKKGNADYEEFTKIPFYFNGSGFIGEAVSRLYVYKVSSNHFEPITSEFVSVHGFELNDTCDKLLYTACNDVARPTLRDGLFEYDLTSSVTNCLIEEKDYHIGSIQYFDGKVLFIGNKETTHGNNENGRFFLMDTQTKEITLFYDYSLSAYNSVGSDARFGGGQMHKVVKDKFYYVSTVDEHAHLYSINTQGEVTLEIEMNGTVDCFDVVEDTIMFVGMQGVALQEVYCADTTIVALTHHNDALDECYVATPKEVLFENDGIDFKGWVLLPQDYDSSVKYPAILDIHGGPKTVYGSIYYHEMQLWANMGYIVFFTNPRGSDGRGNEFMDIFGKYGTIDYEDIMKFSDVVLDTYSIDETRVGVTGGSYGGFMTNWIVGHTDRFKCAATQRSISNWVSFYGTSDIGFHFAEDQIHGNIFDSVDKLWEHSPLKYAKNVKTPTLFIHSDEDFRCPLEQGLQFYTALVDLGVETKFVMFRKENHELSRGGLPLHRIKRLSEITNWMEKYLK